jgi:hypothetical protein
MVSPVRTIRSKIYASSLEDHRFIVAMGEEKKYSSRACVAVVARTL